MSSQEYATTADEIITGAASEVSMAFDSRKTIIKEQVSPLVAKLQKDENGKALNNRHNRVILNRILLIMRKLGRDARKDAMVTYKGHDKLITANVKNYYGKAAGIT